MNDDSLPPAIKNDLDRVFNPDRMLEMLMQLQKRGHVKTEQQLPAKQPYQWSQRGSVKFTIVNDTICVVHPMEDGFYHASYAMPMADQHGYVQMLLVESGGAFETQEQAQQYIIAVAEIPF